MVGNPAFTTVNLKLSLDKSYWATECGNISFQIQFSQPLEHPVSCDVQQC